MADNVTVLYAVNGTTKKMKFSGPHIAIQTYRGGRGSVTVHTEDGGPVLRSVHFAEVYVIDRRTEEPNPGAIR